MPYQLLLRNHSENGTLAEIFARGVSLDFANAPFSVGEAQGLPAGCALEFREQGGTMMVCNTGSSAVSLDGEELLCGTERRISHGGILCLHDKELRYYRLHGRPGVSWAANAIGLVAVLGIAFSLLVEVAAFAGFPQFLKRSDGIRRFQELQALNARVDAIRKALNEKELEDLVARDSLSAAFLRTLQEEMERRVAYLRRHGEELTAAERQAQMENLARLEELLKDFAVHPAVLAPFPSVQIDGPVKHLIETK